LCFGGTGHDQHASLNEHFEAVRRKHDDMLATLAARDGDAAERIATAHVMLFRNRAHAFAAGDGLREFEICGAELAAVSLHPRG
jgi:DNA-binding GntR family transcriptional regulator